MDYMNNEDFISAMEKTSENNLQQQRESADAQSAMEESAAAAVDQSEPVLSDDQMSHLLQDQTDALSNAEQNDVQSMTADQESPEEKEPESGAETASAPTPRRRSSRGHFIDTGNDMISAQMPSIEQANDVDEINRAIAQHRVLYASIDGCRRYNGELIIEASRKSVRIMFRPDDFFAMSVLKNADGYTHQQMMVLYERKVSRMFGAVVSFVPKVIDCTGGRAAVLGSRSEALTQLQNRYFFRPTAENRVEVGSVTKASILSNGLRYVIVEAFGVEVSMGRSALAAFRYIRDAREFRVGTGITVAVDRLNIDRENRKVELHVSHAAHELMTTPRDLVDASMIGGRYLATVTAVDDKYYHVVLNNKKIRGVVPRTWGNRTRQMFEEGNEVSLEIRYVNEERQLVIGSAVFVSSGRN